MDDVRVMDRVEPLRDLRRDVPGFGRRQRAVRLQLALQVLARDELHRDVVDRAVLSVLVDPAHVAMPHAARELDLRSEAAGEIRGRGHVGAEDLQGDLFLERAVEGPVDDAHAAASEHLPQLVAAVDDGPFRQRIQGLAAREAMLPSRLVGRSAGRAVQTDGV